MDYVCTFLIGLERKDLLEKIIKYTGGIKTTFVVADGISGVELTCSLPEKMGLLWTRNGAKIGINDIHGITVSNMTSIATNVIKRNY